MTVKSVLKAVCVFLQKDELLETNLFDGEVDPTNDQTKEIEHLVRCLNLVLSEISSDYIPLLKTEEIVSTDGRVLFSQFPKNVLDIYKIVNKFNLTQQFKTFSTYLETAPGELKITYSFEPEKLSQLDDSIEDFSQKVGERIIAYGVAMEYCFICGLHDDASIWEKRFKDGLLIAARKKSTIRLPKRRWI